MSKKIDKLREEARQCVRVAERTADDKVAAALLAYACQLEQRARVIEGADKPRGKTRPAAARAAKSAPTAVPVTVS